LLNKALNKELMVIRYWLMGEKIEEKMNIEHPTSPRLNTPQLNPFGCSCGAIPRDKLRCPSELNGAGHSEIEKSFTPVKQKKEQFHRAGPG